MAAFWPLSLGHAFARAPAKWRPEPASRRQAASLPPPPSRGSSPYCAGFEIPGAAASPLGKAPLHRKSTAPVRAGPRAKPTSFHTAPRSAGNSAGVHERRRIQVPRRRDSDPAPRWQILRNSFSLLPQILNSRHSPASVLRAAFPVSPTITRVPGATWNAPCRLDIPAPTRPLRSSFLPTRKEPRFRETTAATTTPRSAPVRAALEFPPSAPVCVRRPRPAPLLLPRCSLLRAKTRAATAPDASSPGSARFHKETLPAGRA